MLPKITWSSLISMVGKSLCHYLPWLAITNASGILDMIEYPHISEISTFQVMLQIIQFHIFSTHYFKMVFSRPQPLHALARPGDASNTGVGTERAAERALPERLWGSAQPDPAVMSLTRICRVGKTSGFRICQDNPEPCF